MLPIIRLVIFDFDDTLCYGLDGGFISGCGDDDDVPVDYTFRCLEPGLVQRSDGRRFRLFPETRTLLDDLSRRGVLLSLASYNHPQATFAALDAFGLRPYFRHPVVAWHGRKDQMIERILAALRDEGCDVAPAASLFIDDDRSGRYRLQMQLLGVHFLQMGGEISKLDQIFRFFAFERR